MRSLITMTTRNNMPSRRSALQLFGASAALVPPVLGFSAYAVPVDAPGSEPILSLDSVPLSWPVYHRLMTSDDMPEIGSPLFFERDVRHPSGEWGIVVYMQSGNEKLGFVTRQHHAALDWALVRAGRIDARITQVNEPVVRGRRVPGWGSFHISVKVWDGVAAV